MKNTVLALCLSFTFLSPIYTSALQKSTLGLTQKTEDLKLKIEKEKKRAEEKKQAEDKFKKDKPAKPDKPKDKKTIKKKPLRRKFYSENAIISGPFVTAVYPHSAIIWINTRHMSNINIGLSNTNNNEYQDIIQHRQIPNFSRGIKTFNLTDLKPDTKYYYSITATTKNDKDLDILDSNTRPFTRLSKRQLNRQQLNKVVTYGSFKTPPLANTPTTLRIAATAGLNNQESQDKWTNVINYAPDLHLILGNTIQADFPIEDDILEKHFLSRRNPLYTQLTRNTPTFAIWDHNDITGNSGQANKNTLDLRKALYAFKKAFPNPAIQQRPGNGIYFTHTYGDIQFFMLDTRYHRTPNSHSVIKEKQMLGPIQFKWLKEVLTTSKAKFKIIVSSNTLTSNNRNSWSAFPTARKKLLSLITKNKIKGVVFLTANNQPSTILRHKAKKNTPGAYRIYEIITSDFSNLNRSTFAILDFNTKLKEPTINARIINNYGKTLMKHTIKLSELK